VDDSMCDMVGSVFRAGLPETGTSTPQRSGQGSKTAAGRKRPKPGREDLDRENGVIAWRNTARPPFP
jgi:hypothetical protein